MNTETPLVDAEVASHDFEAWTNTGSISVVSSTFARKLERERAACVEALEKAKTRLHHAGSFSATIIDTLEIVEETLEALKP